MEYYLALKKNDVKEFAGKWMDLECAILIKFIQSHKEVNYMLSL